MENCIFEASRCDVSDAKYPEGSRCFVEEDLDGVEESTDCRQIDQKGNSMGGVEIKICLKGTSGGRKSQRD